MSLVLIMSIKSTFKAVFDYSNTQYNHNEETDLADLVLAKNVEDFNLRHGYRAQTHLGSMMMYHSIIEAAKSPTNNDLKSFWENWQNRLKRVILECLS